MRLITAGHGINRRFAKHGSMCETNRVSVLCMKTKRKWAEKKERAQEYEMEFGEECKEYTVILCQIEILGYAQPWPLRSNIVNSETISLKQTVCLLKLRKLQGKKSHS